MADLTFPLEGSTKVIEGNRNALLNMFEAKYVIGDFENSVLVWKSKILSATEDDDMTKRSYDLLMGFHHENATERLNFYFEEKSGEKRACVVIPKCIDLPFTVWFENEGKDLLFKEEGKMTHLCRDMTVSLCDVIEKLRSNKIFPQNLTKEDMYVQKRHNSVRLLVLLTQVQTHMRESQKDATPFEGNNFVKDLIDWCSTKCGVQLDTGTQCFVDFIVNDLFTTEKLRKFPDTWDSEMKGNYLLLLLSNVTQATVRKKIKKAGILWPTKIPQVRSGKNKKKIERADLPDLLATILSHHESESGHKKRKSSDESLNDESLQNQKKSEDKVYNLNDAYDYVRILKHSYKHYDELPDDVKNELGSRAGLICKIDDWNPAFWISLYQVCGNMIQEVRPKASGKTI